MSPPTHPNVARVVEAAARAGLAIEVAHQAAGARTAQDAANAIGCEVGQIVKSLVFVADGRPMLALVSGANRLDTARVAGAMGAADVRRASAQEARVATGFAIGGVPPFGHASLMPVLVDADLLRHEVVHAAAGLPDATFPIEPNELVRASGGRVVDLAERADRAD
jgi:prolyl-tRNA editing enzyme YbaK/EbsC (Cys-tRNA(Pro) deacylase)